MNHKITALAVIMSLSASISFADSSGDVKNRQWGKYSDITISGEPANQIYAGMRVTEYKGTEANKTSDDGRMRCTKILATNNPYTYCVITFDTQSGSIDSPWAK